MFTPMFSLFNPLERVPRFGFLGDLLFAGGKALVDALRGKSKANAEDEQIRLMNEFLSADEDAKRAMLNDPEFMNLVMNPTTTSNYGSQQLGTSATSGVSKEDFERGRYTTAPYKGGEAALRGQVFGDLEKGGLTPAERMAMLKDVNRRAAAADAAVNGSIGSKGLTGPAAAALRQRANLARVAELGDVSAEADATDRALRIQRQQAAQNLISALGSRESGSSTNRFNQTGQTTGTTTGMNTTTGPGDYAFLSELRRPTQPRVGPAGNTPFLDALSGGVEAGAALYNQFRRPQTQVKRNVGL